MGTSWLAAALIGLAAGYLSGQFGIGGGIVTTPAIRLVLGYPELIAVGTPLPVIIPTAIAGVVSYARRGLVDVRVGLAIGAVGGVFSAAGAWAATQVGGRAVLVATAAVICWMAVDMTLLALRPAPATGESPAGDGRGWPWVVALGITTGLYSGFLGLGGGFLVVPSLIRHFDFPAKRAVGTSLVAVSVLAIPGTLAHYALGNVDVPLALSLAVGVVPGALLGAHVTALARERTVRIGFAALLVAVGVLLAATELGLVG